MPERSDDQYIAKILKKIIYGRMPHATELVLAD
jgi:hypothetical protein